jgi:hypothetical protein
LIVGDRLYKATTITLPPGLVGKVSAATILTVDPSSYNKAKLSSAIFRINLYDLMGVLIEPSLEEPITFSVDVDLSARNSNHAV